jgi:hypothetical protein
MEYLGFIFIQISFMGMFYYIIDKRLDSQDSYLTAYMRSFAQYNGDTLPPFLDSTEIKEEITRKPEVYSPRHDPETVMQGHVIDPFD